ncbi:hypothetical protein [Bowmanella denitrificans]|uniref:hypothetical protein n=1 Tax=Bowmanella denitrificans TaxID=366582 RepID=UPI000C9C8419|nr:hypothetical protein [Bowmanella denitrificans]
MSHVQQIHQLLARHDHDGRAAFEAAVAGQDIPAVVWMAALNAIWPYLQHPRLHPAEPTTCED